MSHGDKNVRITFDRCDLCNDPLPQTEDNVNNNLESRMILSTK